MTLEILLLNTSRDTLYHPGQEIRGNVIITLETELKISNITIVLLGEAFTKWSETYDNETRIYSDVQKYCKYEVCLSKKCVLEQGKYEFPFRFVLPKKIPSTYKGSNGCVKFSLEAKIYRSNTTTFATHELELKVCSPLDLNLYPEIWFPFTINAEQTTCCLCWKSKLVHIKIRIPSRGFVPSEKIAFDINCSNLSGTKIDELILKLIGITTYHANVICFSSTVEYNTLSDIKVGPILSGASENFHALLPIPNDTVATLQYCHIMKINYIIRMEVVANADFDKLDVEFPIVLGDIKIRTPRLQPQSDFCALWRQPMHISQNSILGCNTFDLMKTIKEDDKLTSSLEKLSLLNNPDAKLNAGRYLDSQNYDSTLQKEHSTNISDSIE